MPSQRAEVDNDKGKAGAVVKANLQPLLLLSVALEQIRQMAHQVTTQRQPNAQNDRHWAADVQGMGERRAAATYCCCLPMLLLWPQPAAPLHGRGDGLNSTGYNPQLLWGARALADNLWIGLNCPTSCPELGRMLSTSTERSEE